MTDEINEIAAAARDAKRVREAAADPTVYNRQSWPVVPIAIGVGSAALAAAFLYVNGSRKK
ncbi:hypothetical protein PX554_02010 [Sphingomonas sp. H39-1-10]|uniref:hypothetical protein n=1 Tax=Sphingomonas TaxID=13687 RepID=UPI000880720C|nr:MULTISPECIES: hypothetical protein [Sphingomonas]MDF0486890.1 hypothetical protein [Sphingomonas pollutisoli]SDA34707.1 hypothetical protein SAMN03159340_03089 [Sphingomonas sp. NFR15]